MALIPKGWQFLKTRPVEIPQRGNNQTKYTTKRILVPQVCMLAIGAASTQAKMIAVKGIVTDAKSKDPLF